MLTGTKVLKKSLEKSSKTAVEAINNIRTVAGLRCEGKVIEEYANSLKAFFSQTKFSKEGMQCVSYSQSITILRYNLGVNQISSLVLSLWFSLNKCKCGANFFISNNSEPIWGMTAVNYFTFYIVHGYIEECVT